MVNGLISRKISGTEFFQEPVEMGMLETVLKQSIKAAFFFCVYVGASLDCFFLNLGKTMKF